MPQSTPPATEQKITFDVAELSETDAYKLASGLTVPRPIGWIGTTSASGINNLAPYSFFNMVATYPPTFVVSPSLGPRKDTLTNITDTGVFSVNIVSEDTVESMNKSSAAVAADVDEFAYCGLSAVTSQTSTAPLVAEAVASFECTLVDIVPVGRARDGSGATNMMIIGEALRIHVAERVCSNKLHIDPHKLQAVGRLAGGWYSRTSDALFEIDRPK